MISSLTNRVNTFLLVLIALMAAAIIAILASRASAGPLDPPGPPASTMHTLDDVYNVNENQPQVWDQVLNSTNGSGGGPSLPAGCNSDRFACLFRRVTGPLSATYDGVLDRETGLVWQRSPGSAPALWTPSVDNCVTATTGSRLGWRLPTVEELLSLTDSTGNVPTGSPFAGITAGELFWTSTDLPDDTTGAWVLEIGFGAATQSKSGLAAHWCVRGAASNK